MTMEEFRKRIVNSSCSYKFLGSEDGFWIGADEEWLIEEMSTEYKKNCIKYLEKHSQNIETGFFLKGVKYNKNEKDELIRLGRIAMQNKTNELSE